jgi:hypothetical protein
LNVYQEGVGVFFFFEKLLCGGLLYGGAVSLNTCRISPDFISVFPYAKLIHHFSCLRKIGRQSLGLIQLNRCVFVIALLSRLRRFGTLWPYGGIHTVWHTSLLYTVAEDITLALALDI